MAGSRCRALEPVFLEFLMVLWRKLSSGNLVNVVAASLSRRGAGAGLTSSWLSITLSSD